jgi:hypothetical protein
MIGHSDSRKSSRAMNAFMKMKKRDLPAPERAYSEQAA